MLARKACVSSRPVARLEKGRGVVKCVYREQPCAQTLSASSTNDEGEGELSVVERGVKRSSSKRRCLAKPKAILSPAAANGIAVLFYEKCSR